MPQSENEPALAVLIDADNVQPAVIGGLLAEVAKLGRSTVKRIYGDWTSPRLQGWIEMLREHSIHPVHQSNYTPGKNASDIALVIDAMDLLHAGHLDGFCLVSSDSDFTRLASRIRETGRKVYAFGEGKTPIAFRKTCDRFFDTARWAPQPMPKSKPDPEPAKGGSGSKKAAMPRKRFTGDELSADGELMELLRQAIKETQNEAGWASVSAIGSRLGQIKSGCGARQYGYAKLSDLIKASGQFAVEKQANECRVKFRETKSKAKTELAVSVAKPESQPEFFLLPPPGALENPASRDDRGVEWVSGP